MGDIRILSCDDEEEYREIIEKGKPLLKKEWGKISEHHTVDFDTCADIVKGPSVNGSKSIQEAGQYDLFLLDICKKVGKKEVPKYIETAELIHKWYPEKPIILLSGKAELGHFTKLTSITSDYIPKDGGFNPSTMIAKIYNVWSNAYEDQSGQALYRMLRNVACCSDAWGGKAVNKAASEVWNVRDSSRGKWGAFWKPFQAPLADLRLQIPIENLADTFKDYELLVLGAVSSLRGHLEHTLNVYFTGYVLSHTLPRFRDYVSRASQNLVASTIAPESCWGLFQCAWLFAGTLHDIAYSIEVLPDIAQHCLKIAELCDMVDFTHTQHPLRFKKARWDKPSGKSAKVAFEEVITNLYGKTHRNWIRDHAVFENKEVRSAPQRVNHGVASGIMFLSQISKWYGLGEAPPELPVFTKWAATSMALHAQKKAEDKGSFQISAQKDPLGFLLAISDELQVWNRCRPDEAWPDTLFRRVELASLEVDGNEIKAIIEYIPYDSNDSELEKELERTDKDIQEDERTLNELIDPSPYRLTIENRVRNANDLSTLRLKPR